MIARRYGIRSLYQLHVFMVHANWPDASIKQVLGKEPDDPDYRWHYQHLRKLMMGAPNKNHNGLGLLYFSDSIGPGKEYAVRFTRLGEALRRELTEESENGH